MFIFLRGGILVRNFANQEMRNIMRASGHRFVLFSPEPDHPYFARQFSDPCFVLARMERDSGLKALGATRLRSFLVQVRRFTYGNTRFSENGCRQSLIGALKSEQMSTSSFVGRLFYRSILWTAALGSRFRMIRELLAWLEDRLTPFDAHAKYYRQYQPVMTIVTSLGFDLDSLVMREARRHSAKVTVLVKNWDVPTTRGTGGVVPDHVMVWNDTMRDEVARYHDVPQERISLTGVAQWDYYFRSEAAPCTYDAFISRYGLDPKKKTIYFAMTTPSHYKHNVTLTRLLLEAIRDGKIDQDTQLLVRLHPTYVLINGLLSDEVKEELAALEREFGDILAFSRPESEDHNGFLIPGDSDEMALKEILTHSDVMVTVYSTQILEGLIFDLPVINAGMYTFRDTGLPISTYEDWDHVRQVLDREAVYYCYSIDETIAAVNTALANPEQGSAARQRIKDRLFSTELRGQGGEKTGQKLLSLIEQNEAGA